MFVFGNHFDPTRERIEWLLSNQEITSGLVIFNVLSPTALGVHLTARSLSRIAVF
jgi:hypothetical protein